MIALSKSGKGSRSKAAADGSVRENAVQMVGCLLIHGFTGNPNELHDLGESLKARDIKVTIPTLPGHATHSADLLNYSWRDWVEHVQTAYDKLASECEKIFICGLSMGGTLTLKLAMERPAAGLITMATPVRFPIWKKGAVKVLRRTDWFLKKSRGEDVCDTSWHTRLGSYRRYPIYAVSQLFQLVDHVAKRLPEVRQPLLIIHSKRDNTIHLRNAGIIYDKVSSRDKQKVVLDRSYHIITVDVESDRVTREIHRFIEERV